MAMFPMPCYAGSNARALEKARGVAADSLILDLEDAVAPNAKPAARDLVAKALSERAFGKREVRKWRRFSGAALGWPEHRPGLVQCLAESHFAYYLVLCDGVHRLV